MRKLSNLARVLGAFPLTSDGEAPPSELVCAKSSRASFMGGGRAGETTLGARPYEVVRFGAIPKNRLFGTTPTFASCALVKTRLLTKLVIAKT